VSNLDSNDPLEHLMLNNSTTKDENPKLAFPPILPFLARVKLLKDESKPLSDEAKALEVELKPLPSSLRYEFLGPTV